ncbi:hypothetical protein N7537_008629 [Penicillium hordei]|uniref:Uncharacterized protein n=1 Tax=Penicillium hordei TaxID=40994 RepID=A0AAD6E0U6_9EURO|nr:uncharacterized protein N7537_008629 [Penicillium hordei]KAJ5598545.1 hypothetical protein N7537_008629 [Penicillium hordei]
MDQAFSRRMGQSLRMASRPICSLFMAAIKAIGYMFKWFHNEDINPETKTLDTWLENDSVNSRENKE